MANSKKITGYNGSATTVTIPTSIDNVLVREIANNAMSGASTVVVKAHLNEVAGAPWGAQNVVWDKDPKCTVSFDANGGSGSMDNDLANIGRAYTLPANEFVAPSGKRFKNWSVGGTEYAPATSVVFTASTGVVKAIWQNN